MQVAILKYLATMQQHSIWSGMDQRQNGELVILVLSRCPGEGSSFLQVRLVHEKNLNSSLQGSLSMIADGLKKNMIRCCVRPHRLTTIMTGSESVMKSHYGRKKHMTGVSRNACSSQCP